MDRRIILKWLLEKYECGWWMDSGQAGSCEHGNEPSVFMKGRKFLE
jgi:hypothetical protein